MRILSVALATFLALPVPAAEHREEVLRDSPAAYWRFDDALDCCAQEATDKRALKADRGENVSLIAPGPRAPKFPNFDAHNVAADFTEVKSGAFLRVADPGARSEFDFQKDTTITIEAWVQCRALGEGRLVYIISKGRTGNPGTKAGNQSWALCLRGARSAKGAVACPSFLFRDAKNDGDRSWHRWTTTRGFPPGEEWHHLVVSYTFGKPGSAKAWVNGVALDGAWDLGGATTLEPVLDDDEVWIGGSMGGAAENQFPGAIDEVAVYRAALPQERIARHAQREGPLPELAAVTSADPVPPAPPKP